MFLCFHNNAKWHFLSLKLFWNADAKMLKCANYHMIIQMLAFGLSKGFNILFPYFHKILQFLYMYCSPYTTEEHSQDTIACKTFFTEHRINCFLLVVFLFPWHVILIKILRTQKFNIVNMYMTWLDPIRQIICKWQTHVLRFLTFFFG